MNTATNIPASIHQKILNKAIAEQRVFNELLQYFAIERFLLRLGESRYGKKFVLKGSFVFLAWQVPLTRPTRDMDFLGFTENTIQNLVLIVKEICIQSVENDGIEYDPDSVTGEIIKEEADYQGIRITFLAYLGKARIHMRLDVGFADIVTPPPENVEIPTILDNMQKPYVRAYPPETVIAEKFQTMVYLGKINSRMKDFYDLWFMAKKMKFDFDLVYRAIRNTCEQRKTQIPETLPFSISEEFAHEKQSQWTSFLKKNQIDTAPQNFIDVVQILRIFFTPFILQKEYPPHHWYPEMGWE
jgi:predicted nucleotidyltransferase component of viral defense system